ncbi:MAG: TetR/AcrR family transcriptional regulator [Vicinamibacterales bacterium]
MGIAERRARHHRSLKSEILEQARQMFVEEGYERVSMRRLAERIEYSPTTIYLYFKDKNALFEAICEQTFETLVRRLEKHRRRHEGDPLAYLRAGLGEYIDFGLKHPEHYLVTFMRRPPGEAPEDFGGTAGERAFGMLRTAVAEAAEAGLLRPVHPEVAAQVLWMSVHGLVSLLVARKGFPFAPRAALIDTQVETLVRGLVAGPG